MFSARYGGRTIVVASAAAFLLGFQSSILAFPETGGTPLGGMGTGYVVYNARDGAFTKGNHPSGWYNESWVGGGFHLYTRVNGAVQSRSSISTTTEDAKVPIYTADYGGTQNVDFRLLAFAPINPGDEYLASLPLAFFEFTATNNNASQVEAGMAIQFPGMEGSNPSGITNGIAWSGATNTTVMGGSSDAGAVISSGNNAGDFTDDGVLGNVGGDVLGIKATIPANQSVTFRFVISWYRTFYNEHFYYHNHYATSQPIAEYGLQNFVTIRDRAKRMVDRTMAINLPEWFTDRLLNNLYPLIHNVQMTKDGRVAVREGCYSIIGTLDQQGHAQIPLSLWFPDLNWRQMMYWGRTQFQGSADGQIHHDFNAGADEYLCGWDDHSHGDYPYGGDITVWADLNLHFVISTYELFLASGNRDSLQAIWPYLKKTGDRLLVQCSWGGANSYLPSNCKSTYDRTGATNEYNGGLALVAYEAMADMASVLGDATEESKWRTQYENARPQYVSRHWTDNFGRDEAHLGGYTFARSLGLKAIMDDDKTRTTFDRMYTAYNNGLNTGLWHAYTCAHFADLGIAIGEVDKGMTNHRADWEEYYQGHGDFVFWQGLDHGYTHCSYMTMPFVWRSLFLIEGYTIDMYRKALWIRPNLPSSLNKQLTNGVIMTADAWGTLNYDENIVDSHVQDITMDFDNPVAIKTLILRNNTGVSTPTVVVTKGGALVPLAAAVEGSGLDEIIRVTFDNELAVDNAGVNVKVYPHAVGTLSDVARPVSGIGIASTHLSAGEPIVFHTDRAGRVRLVSLDAAGRTLATLVDGVLPAGPHTVRCSDADNGVVFVRLSSGSASCVKRLVVAR